MSMLEATADVHLAIVVIRVRGHKTQGIFEIVESFSSPATVTKPKR